MTGSGVETAKASYDGVFVVPEIGYERRTNPMLRRITSEDIFVRECLDLQDLPAVPPYWIRMRPENLSGPALLGTLAEPPALDVEDVDGGRGRRFQPATGSSASTARGTRRCIMRWYSAKTPRL